MNENKFRKWIEAGFKNYGKDPWFFLRELAQNSRDAGADSITVKAHRSGNNEIISFEDDGNGMSYTHAQKYLFRLYASSKTNDKSSAGMFGIGFWTIFKFNPHKIIIESSFKNEKWAVSLDDALNSSSSVCSLSKNGTRISLIRNARESS
ncbi:MAG: hypothetical protein GY757_14290, partial [bacterium]|nr:hypothetical protein [bacterium]